MFVFFVIPGSFLFFLAWIDPIVCMHACMHVCIHACIHACTPTYLPACMHACMDAYTHVQWRGVYSGSYGMVVPPEQGMYHMVDGHKLGGLVV